MAKQLRVYTLNDLPPEVRAVCFAKCSRAPEAFDEIAKELTAEKSSEFHEKWVVGYGHGSVAEHAVLSIAIENASSLACKVIEDNRLSSFTEKSSRYQVFSKDSYYTPQKIANSKYRDLYKETIEELYDVYGDLFTQMKEFIKKKYPKDEKMGAPLYEAVSKARTLDNVRYLLPLCSFRNLGWTINARVLENALCKLLSHPLEEVREVGRKIKAAGLQVAPTLIKYADYNECQAKTRESMERIAQDASGGWGEPQAGQAVRIVDYDDEAENKLVASFIYRYSHYSFKQILEKVRTMEQRKKEEIIEENLKHRGKFDQPTRELEHVYYTFDIFMDFSAFYDLQRHRMCTQTNQLETGRFGYNTPPEIVEAGFEKSYQEAQERALDLYAKLSPSMPYESQYGCTFAFYHRTLYTWNLRELHHLISLRSKPQGHWSYRQIARQCWEELNKIHPLLAKYIRVYRGESGAHT